MKTVRVAINTFEVANKVELDEAWFWDAGLVPFFTAPPPAAGR